MKPDEYTDRGAALKNFGPKKQSLALSRYIYLVNQFDRIFNNVRRPLIRIVKHSIDRASRLDYLFRCHTIGYSLGFTFIKLFCGMPWVLP